MKISNRYLMNRINLCLISSCRNATPLPLVFAGPWFRIGSLPVGSLWISLWLGFINGMNEGGTLVMGAYRCSFVCQARTPSSYRRDHQRILKESSKNSKRRARKGEEGEHGGWRRLWIIHLFGRHQRWRRLWRPRRPLQTILRSFVIGSSCVYTASTIGD